jgi:hypothetical protein
MRIPSQAEYALYAVAAFEAVAWLLDPLGVHTALNDGEPMPLHSRALAAAVNAGIPLFLGGALAARGPKRIALAFPLFTMFCFNQWIFWWWPYFLGSAAGTGEMAAEHAAQLSGVEKMLPALADNRSALVPDTEHTVLLPLSMNALVFAFPVAGSVLRTGAAARFHAAVTVLAAALPLGFVDWTAPLTSQLGPLFTSGLILAANVAAATLVVVAP